MAPGCWAAWRQRTGRKYSRAAYASRIARIRHRVVLRSADAFEDAHIVRDRGTAHVEKAAEPRVLDLEIAGRAGELHGGERMHRHAGGADRMAFGLEPARRVDRQPPADLGDALLDGACAAPCRDEAHGFVFDQLGDCEAVVRLDEREIAERDAGRR